MRCCGKEQVGANRDSDVKEKVWIGHTLGKLANSITRQPLEPLEPLGKEEEGSSKELLEKGCGIWNEEVGPHLELGRKACSGQKSMENWTGLWPMFQLELRGKSS